MIDFDALVLGPCMDAFGEPVTFSPAAGGAHAVTGVFNEAYHAITGYEDGTPVVSEMPVLGIRLSTFPVEPAQGDRVTIRNEVYVVREVRPDGRGHANLFLNYAEPA